MIESVKLTNDQFSSIVLYSEQINKRINRIIKMNAEGHIINSELDGLLDVSESLEAELKNDLQIEIDKRESKP